LGLSSWPLSWAVPGAGDPWDNLTGFLKFHFTNLSRRLNDLAKDREKEKFPCFSVTSFISFNAGDESPELKAVGLNLTSPFSKFFSILVRK
jgi:hypothetical protein